MDRKTAEVLHPEVPLAGPGRLEDLVNQGLYAGPRFGFLLLTLFGCVRLILATVGVYSVLAYSTTLRIHEIGIRMALGAGGKDVLGWSSGAGCESLQWGSRLEWP
jgi:hypothetical protein